MSESTKKNLLNIATVVIALVVGAFSVVGIQRVSANTKKNEAVAYAEVDATAKVMLDDHARRLTVHDGQFLKNSEDHKDFSEQLNIYSQTQTAIKQAQGSLKETQKRMEDSQTEFQGEIRGDIKLLIKETSEANAWIKNIENVKDNENGR